MPKEEVGGFFRFTIFSSILQNFLSIHYVLGSILGTKHTMVNKMGKKIPALRELRFVCVCMGVYVCMRAYVCTHTHTQSHTSMAGNPGEGSEKGEERECSGPCLLAPPKELV